MRICILHPFLLVIHFKYLLNNFFYKIKKKEINITINLILEGDMFFLSSMSNINE